MHKKFEYTEQPSDLFGKVKRPLITVEIFSQTKNFWITINKVLADTGADISILPRYIGELLIDDITKGSIYKIRGIVPYSFLTCYIHELKIKINGNEFIQKVAVAESDDVPAVLVRVNGLDLFDVKFSKGKELNFENT